MSKEYIDRNELLKLYQDDKLDLSGTSIPTEVVIQNIKDIPAADVVEVVHGKNITAMHPVDEFLCSECGFCCSDYTQTKYDEDGDYTYSCECEFDYCPNCGAKMEGGTANE